jgi:hypothetical protein
MYVTRNIPSSKGIIGLHQMQYSSRYPMAIAPLVGVLLLAFLLAGCSGVHQTSRRPSDNSAMSSGPVKDATIEKISALQKDISTLNRQANIGEARQIAETAVTYSKDLAEEYDLVRPAVLHNVFVRIGFKDRGLCYHWTEDLIKRLQALDLKTYQLHWGVAYRGSELREHNTVVITAGSEAFESGMVLDPWRNSGDLYWALVKADTYPWEELPPDEW